MYNCKSCGVSVTGEKDRCPLCQGPLEGVPEENIYPDIPVVFRPLTLMRWSLFASVAASILCVVINLLTPHEHLWCLFVVAGVGSLWLSLYVVLKKRRNVIKGILWMTFLISALSVTWDLLTGFFGWSVDYVLPLLFSCSMTAMYVMAKITHLNISDYLVYLLIDVVFALVPLVLLLTGVAEVRFPSIVSIAVAALSLSALVIFAGDGMRAELYRRMHL